MNFYNQPHYQQTLYPNHNPVFYHSDIALIPSEGVIDGIMQQQNLQHEYNATAHLKSSGYDINIRGKSGLHNPPPSNYSAKQEFLQRLEKSLANYNYIDRTLAARSIGLSRKTLSNLDSDPKSVSIEVKVRIKNRIFYEKNSYLKFVSQRLG